MNNMYIYSVINMDIVNSRKILDRLEFQSQLKEYFKKVDFKYEDILVAPITFTLGDEWQIVLRDVSKSYNIFNEIKNFLLLNNVQGYCGIGIGTISTNESNDTREMDGEAFIYARKAINTAKISNRFYNKEIHTKDCRAILMGKPIYMSNIYRQSDYDIEEIGMKEVAVTAEAQLHMVDIINGLIQNNEMIESKITHKQREIISLYENHGSYNEIEKNYPQFSKSSISHKLTASNYFLTVNNKNLISNLLGVYTRSLKEI